MMKEKKRIIVVGSCNTDMVIRVDHLPLPGETIIGHDFITNQGGKGANQAVAVKRLGGDTAFIARLGNDDFGAKSLRLLTEEGIDTSCVKLTEGVSTGVALIPVDDSGENSIIVASGANAMLSPADIEEAEALFEDTTNAARDADSYTYQCSKTGKATWRNRCSQSCTLSQRGTARRTASTR